MSAYAAQEPVVVWPDNRQAVEVFRAMDTQWLAAGMGGATGLNYASLPSVWEAMGLTPEERQETFEPLRWLEKAALTAMHDNKD